MANRSSRRIWRFGFMQGLVTLTYESMLASRLVVVCFDGEGNTGFTNTNVFLAVVVEWPQASGSSRLEPRDDGAFTVASKACNDFGLYKICLDGRPCTNVLSRSSDVCLARPANSVYGLLSFDNDKARSLSWSRENTPGLESRLASWTNFLGL